VLSAAVSLATSLTGCVIYKPAAETTHVPSDSLDAERIRLSVGPRRYLETIAHLTMKQDKRLQQVDGQTFLDAASPDRPLTLARLLDPQTTPLITALKADYLVLLAEPEFLASRLELLVASETSRAAAAWVALVDLRSLRVIEQTQSRAAGRDYSLAYPPFWVLSDTNSSATLDLVRNVVAKIASERPMGTVGLVFLADEPIPTAAEVARAERSHDDTEARWKPERYARFLPAVASESEALVYLYRPETSFGAYVPFDVHARIAGRDALVARLWNGGYFPLEVPAGEVTLWLSSDPMHIVSFDAKAGETFYAEALTGQSWGLAQAILFAPPGNSGKGALAKCVLMPSASRADSETLMLAEIGHPDRQFEMGTLYASGVSYADGQSLPRDLVEAYKWFSLAASSDSWRSPATASRNAIVPRMSAVDVEEAERRVLDWSATHATVREEPRLSGVDGTP